MTATLPAYAAFDSSVRIAYTDAERREAFLPTPCVQNHAANLHVLPNGDLLCVWFGGTQEGIPDVSVYLSRLPAGGTEWQPALKLSEDPTRSEQNPVLFTTPAGALWLIYTAQLSGHQNTAIVRRRISTDGGHNWGPIETLFDQAGTFVRQPIVVLPDGAWACPVFLCRTQPGERWVGNDDISAIMLSADQGRTWSAPQPTALPNNNSSIQFVALRNGHLALVYNDSDASHSTGRRTSLYDDIEDAEDHGELRDQSASTCGTAFWGAPRAPLSLAISEDGGQTWRRRRNLEIGDGYCMTNNSAEQRNREYSYPSIVQGVDGALHIAFTYFRQRIKYVTVDEAWVRG